MMGPRATMQGSLAFKSNHFKSEAKQGERPEKTRMQRTNMREYFDLRTRKCGSSCAALRGEEAVRR
jgi:hypothetical protein